MQLDARHLVQDPAWLPHRYDATRDALGFAHAPADVRDRIVFLDPRFMQDVRLSPLAPIADLAAEIAGPAAPLHFIFHTALCCSTLLVRALAQPGLAAGSREPFVMISIDDALLRQQSETARRALEIVLDLLSRPLNAGEVQIVKPSNTVNFLAPEVLRLRPQSKLLLLYSDLESFLVSASGKDRSFGPNLVARFQARAPTFPPLLHEPLETHLHAAAYAWLKQVSLFDQIIRAQGPARVRSLNSATFLARKAETLARAGRFLGIIQSAEAWRSVAEGPLFEQHAKSPSRAFNEKARRTLHADGRAAHAHEIDAALNWAEALAASQSLPLTLGDTLFDEPL
jgi:hypothetical protein